jgi:hypothetical protein
MSDIGMRQATLRIIMSHARSQPTASRAIRGAAACLHPSERAGSPGWSHGGHTSPHQVVNTCGNRE